MQKAQSRDRHPRGRSSDTQMQPCHSIWETRHAGYGGRKRDGDAETLHKSGTEGALCRSPACRGQHLGSSEVKLCWRGCCRDTCSATDETTAGNSVLAKLGDGQNHTSQTHFPRGQTLTRLVCRESFERGSSGFSCQSPEPRDKEELLSSFSSCPHSISPSGADVSLRLL